MADRKDTKPRGDHAANVPTDAITPINVPAFYSSSFQLMFAGNDITLVASMLKPILISNGGQKETATMLDPVAVMHLSVGTAKDLAVMLQGFVEFYEANHGIIVTDFTKTEKDQSGATGG